MPLNVSAVLAVQFPENRVCWTRKDSMLYALGVGFGWEPADEKELAFVYEKGLLASPAMSTVLAPSGSLSAYPQTGITRSKVVHGEQGFEIHWPLPAEGEFVGQWRVTGVVDKGADSGALVYTEGVIREAGSPEVLCTLTSTTFCRADGGCGGTTMPAKVAHTVPARPPDSTLEILTFPNAALVYRLSGDYNPLHVDPKAAMRAGYSRPILHGRATFGIAARALLRLFCGYRPEQLTAMDARFRGEVYPGETLRMEVWDDGGGALSFRATVPARSATVLDGGRARVRSAD